MAATTDANTAIKNRLAAMSSFHPATVNLFDGWLLDPGDIVTVSQGEDDFSVPVYRMDVTWKGSSRTEIQSTGSEKRPPLSALKRRSYAGGKQQTETEQELIRHRTDIEKTDERILLWATEEEWDAMKADYVLHHRTQVEIIDDKFSARVTRTELDTTLNGYIEVTALATEMGNVMASSDGTVVAASIATAINAQTATSAVRISADMVTISGATKISDVFGVNQYGDVTVAGDIYQSGTIHPTGVSIAAGGTVDFISGTAPLTYVSLSGANVPNLLNSLSLTPPSSGSNTYTLSWTTVGNSTPQTATFSRATTLRGGFGSGTQADPYYYWQSGIFKVQADPQEVVKQTSLTTTGHWGVTADSEDDKTYYGTVKATIDTSPTLVDTGKTFEVNASAIWQAGYDAGGGGQITTPTLSETWGSGAQAGRLTVNTTPTAASNPLEYWFSNGTITWNGNTATVPITTAPSQQGAATTRFSITVDGSGRYNAGWGDAYADVQMPSAVSTETTSFVVKTPSSTVGGSQVNNTFNISKSLTPSASGNVYVNLNGSNVGQISIGNYYTAGSDYGKVITSLTGTWSKTGSSADDTNTLTIDATSQGGGADSDTMNLALSFGSAWNGTNFPVNLKEGTTLVGTIPVTCWLYYATNQSGHGSHSQGDLPANSYMCLGFTDGNGNVVKNEDYTWRVPSSTNPTIGGSWNGSGTYTITSSPSPASGSKTTVTPSIQLNGSGGSSFSAELLDDTSNHNVQKSVTGYLHQSGSTVGVYKTYSGGTYSNIIASITVSGSSSSVNDISLLDTITWYDSTAPTPSGTSLTSLASMIQSHKNDRGYIRFSAKLNGVSGTKWYKIAIG